MVVYSYQEKGDAISTAHLLYAGQGVRYTWWHEDGRWHVARSDDVPHIRNGQKVEADMAPLEEGR